MQNLRVPFVALLLLSAIQAQQNTISFATPTCSEVIYSNDVNQRGNCVQRGYTNKITWHDASVELSRRLFHVVTHLGSYVSALE